jgi:hypothetical protein
VGLNAASESLVDRVGEHRGEGVAALPMH